MGVDPPLTAEAVKVTEVPAQTGFADGAAVTLTGRSGFTLIVTVFEAAGLPMGQVAVEVSTQITASPFNGTYEKAALVAPLTFAPLTFHWYVGVVPPLTGEAVKMTEVPAQTGFADGEAVTLTGSSGFTVMVTVFELAGLPVEQVALDESTQRTASLLIGTYE